MIDTASDYIYNVYDTCGGDQVDVPTGNGDSEKKPWLRSWLDHEEHFSNLPGPLMQPDEYPCGRNRGVVAWINLPVVREAIHMKPQSFYGHPFTMEAGRALNYQGALAATKFTFLLQQNIATYTSFLFRES